MPSPHQVRAVSDHSRLVVNVSTLKISIGIKENMTQGRYRPQRVRVWSASEPTMGSLTASQNFEMKISKPTVVALISAISVRKNTR